MSRKLAIIADGILQTADTRAGIDLDSREWFDWLADEHHHSFHFSHPCGDFTARKERKQRGHWYWVAYRQVNKKLYKRYLGTSACLTRARLCAAAETLAQTVADAGRGSGRDNERHAPHDRSPGWG
jgi:hypothetical protein